MEPTTETPALEITESNSSSSQEWSEPPAPILLSPVDFLEMLDPDEIEAEALEKLQWGDEAYTPTAAILDVIKDKFRAFEPERRY